MPIGTITPIAAMRRPLPGWLWCDGSPVDAHHYPGLHAMMSSTPPLNPGCKLDDDGVILPKEEDDDIPW